MAHGLVSPHTAWALDMDTPPSSTQNTGSTCARQTRTLVRRHPLPLSGGSKAFATMAWQEWSHMLNCAWLQSVSSCFVTVAVTRPAPLMDRESAWLVGVACITQNTHHDPLLGQELVAEAVGLRCEARACVHDQRPQLLQHTACNSQHATAVSESVEGLHSMAEVVPRHPYQGPRQHMPEATRRGGAVQNKRARIRQALSSQQRTRHR
jgi:hypothetical protein